jgi:signal transduction histidine kinase/CheY-like chemotaxis protein
MENFDQSQIRSEAYLHDVARLTELARTGLTDSAADPSFDRLARLASKILRAPVALVSLVDDHRQFFKSCIGLPEPWLGRRETPLSHSFCRHVVITGKPLIINDARVNPLVKNNQAIEDLGVIAYIGMPLTVNGHVIGSFCAIDVKPRDWTADDIEILRDLTESVVSEIRLRADRDEIALQQIHPDDVERISHVIRQAIASGTSYDEEYRVVQAGGSVRWVVDRGNVERDTAGRPLSLSGSAVDITERKQAEEKAREIEENYRTLYNSIDAGFFIAKLIYDDRGPPVDYRFLATNPAFEKQTKWPDMLGKTVREIAPDLEAFWFETFDTIVRTGEPMRFENSVEALEQRFFDVYGFRIGTAEDRTVAILFNDITSRKQAEKERNRLVEQLHDADRRKDEFLAILAHELRNPLAAISNGAQLLDKRNTPEILSDVRDMIQHQILHLTRLIDDLLDVARISQGKIALGKATAMLADVVRNAVHLVHPLIEQKRHRLTLSLPDRPVRFVADPTRIEQILGNLLTNAAKYTESEGEIHLSAALDNKEIVFSVRDTGVGISAEMLPRVFSLFTQVDTSLHRSQGGLGIGLTLVRNLVELHGGTVTAASQGKGRGSVFTVRIPIVEPAADIADTAAHDSTAPVQGAGRILVVDDNRDTAKTTAILLSHRGYQVELAHDGREALEIARQSRPHVILLDIGLPGMSDYEVASLLRDDERCKDAMLIAVSGYADGKARDRSRASGFQQHLIKPIDFSELYKLIDSLSSSVPGYA